MKKFFYPVYRSFYILELWRKKRFTKAGNFLFITVIASAILGLDTRQTMAYQVFTFLFSLLLISIIWSLGFKALFDIKRILPKFGTCGQPLTYKIIIYNKSKKIQNDLYILEEFEDNRPSLKEFIESTEPFEEKRNKFDKAMGFYRFMWLCLKNSGPLLKEKVIPKLLPSKHEEINIEFVPSSRGRIRFKNVLIARPDPLGIFYSFIKILKSQSLVILPKRYKIPQFSLPGNRRYHSGGISLTASIGESEEFISLRDYRPGDSLKRIHWQSFAKTGKPIVKEYQDEFFVRHALILDTFQKKIYSKIFEEAVSVASSFVCTLENQETLLDLIFVGLETHCFTTGRGISHTDKILEILADVSPCQDKSFSMLTPVILEKANILSGCVCILLSFDEERKDFIRQVKKIGLPTLVLVICESLDPLNYQMSEDFHILEIDKIQECLLKI